MYEERRKILIDKFGKANHFSVPEGYFESFTDQMMDLLPESEARVIEMRPATWWNRLPIKRWLQPLELYWLLEPAAFGWVIILTPTR